MKRVLSIWVAALVAMVAGSAVKVQAQDVTSYFIDGSPMRMEHNAAFAPKQGYLAFPLVGSLSVATNGNMALGSFLVPVDGSLLTIFDTNVSADVALAGLSTGVNSLGFESRIGILNTGWYRKNRKGFISLDVNLKSSASISLPYELFEFVKTAPDYASIPELGANVDLYSEIALGYSFPITKRLYVGVRAKGLVGLASVSASVNQMDIKMAADEWSGDVSGSLTTDQLGYGGAVDIGVDYSLFNNRLKLSAGLNDLGFIKWSAKNNTTESFTNSFSFTGADMDVDGSLDLESAIDFDDFEMVAQESCGSVRMLQSSFSAGAEFLMWKERVSIGAVYVGSYGNRALSDHRVAGVVTFKPSKWFSIASSYSATFYDGNFSDSAVGIAAYLYTPVLSIYGSADILLAKKTPAYYIPINQAATNFSFGLAVPIGRKGIRGVEEWREGAE
ncbi:MAG: DUF5723 family protein [Rikenellaceae bacterium]